MSFDPSKLNPTICRRLLIMHLIKTLPKANVPAMERATGWNRRTIQDIINIGIPGHGAVLEFIQTQGARNNEGVYRIVAPGSFDLGWVKLNLNHVLATLGLNAQQLDVG